MLFSVRENATAVYYNLISNLIILDKFIVSSHNQLQSAVSTVYQKSSTNIAHALLIFVKLLET